MGVELIERELAAKIPREQFRLLNVADDEARSGRTRVRKSRASFLVHLFTMDDYGISLFTQLLRALPYFFDEWACRIVQQRIYAEHFEFFEQFNRSAEC